MKIDKRNYGRLKRFGTSRQRRVVRAARERGRIRDYFGRIRARLRSGVLGCVRPRTGSQMLRGFRVREKHCLEAVAALEEVIAESVHVICHVVLARFEVALEAEEVRFERDDILRRRISAGSQPPPRTPRV